MFFGKSTTDDQYHVIELKDFSNKGIIDIARNVGKDTYDHFYDKLVLLDDSKPLKINIETDGGSLFRLQKIMRNLKRREQKIIAVVKKSAHSAGAILALSCDELHLSIDGSLSAIDPQLSSEITVDYFKTHNLKLLSETFSVSKDDSRKIVHKHLTESLQESRNIIKSILNKRFSEETKDNIMREMFDKPITHEKIFFMEDLQAMGIDIIKC